MSKNMRTEMPTVAAFIDSLRKVFGDDQVNQQLRSGMKGEPGFWACENGNELGTRIASAKTLVGYDDAGWSYAVPIPAGATLEAELRLMREERAASNRKSKWQGSGGRAETYARGRAGKQSEIKMARSKK